MYTWPGNTFRMSTGNASRFSSDRSYFTDSNVIHCWSDKRLQLLLSFERDMKIVANDTDNADFVCRVCVSLFYEWKDSNIDMEYSSLCNDSQSSKIKQLLLVSSRSQFATMLKIWTKASIIWNYDLYIRMFRTSQYSALKSKQLQSNEFVQNFKLN